MTIVKRERGSLYIIGILLITGLLYGMIAPVSLHLHKETSEDKTKKDNIMSYQLTSLAYLKCDDDLIFQKEREVQENKSKNERSIFCSMFVDRQGRILQEISLVYDMTGSCLVILVWKMIQFIHDSDGKKEKKIGDLFIGE